MSDTEKLQRQYDQFVSGFVAPLLLGGTATIEQPIAPGAIGYFQHASSSDSNTDADIFDTLHRIGAAIAPIRTVPWPDRDLILIAMAGYNLAQVTDPELERVFARGHRKKVVAWIDAIIEAIAPPTTRADALSRHALTERIATVTRTDVIAKSWAYTYRFLGRRNLSLLSRPVFGMDFDKEVKTPPLHRLLEDIPALAELGLRHRLRALIARSPITELIRLDLCDGYRFGRATLSVLADDALRGGIAREIAAPPTGKRSGSREWDAAPRLGAALGDPALLEAAPEALYYALALCFEVQMTATLDVPGPALPKRLDLSNPDVARYAAVLPAFFADETMIDEIRAFDAADRGVVQERCALLTQALPPLALEQVAPLVARCQRPRRAAVA